MKVKNDTMIFMSVDHVMGLSRMNDIIIEDDDNYKMLLWDEFKDIWAMFRWDRKGYDRYGFRYIAQAKKIIEGLGYSISECTFYWSDKQPLLIQFNTISDPDGYVIAIAPKIVGDEE